MLTIMNLSAGYADLPVLHDISLTLQPAVISVLMGPNGAGKSTLLKAICNLVTVTAGSVRIGDEEIISVRSAQLQPGGVPTHRLLARGLVYVPQGKINFSTLTVRENLQLGAYHEKNKATIRKKISAVYDQFPVLEAKANQRAYLLSGGQQQMLALGRALMAEPKVLLLDEPSLGLAPNLVKEVFQVIKSINERRRTTILIVEHNIRSVLDIADFVYIMANGRLLAADTASNLRLSDIVRKVFVGELE